MGVDGSDNSRRALRWGLAEAARRGCPLRAVYAWYIPAVAYGDPALPVGDGPDFEREGHEILEKVLAAVDEVPVGVEVRSVVTEGPPAVVLRDLADRDEVALVVVGSRGRGGVAGLLLGSVSQSLASRPPKPVVIVPGRDGATADGPIVVGVDGSPGADAALDWAAGEAALGGARLEVVTARAGGAEPAQDAQRIQDAAAARLPGGLAGVDHVVVEGRPVEALLGRAEHARLVVVGCRGVGAVHEMLLGSTSHALAHLSPAPVAIIPTPAA